MTYRWYLSARAVREFARIRRLPLDDGGPRWAEAERQLGEVCDRASLRESAARTDGGLLVYQTGRPDGRLRLLVSDADRPEGDLDQLVSVLERRSR